MPIFDEEEYRSFFRRLTKQEPYGYQVSAARLLCQGKNLILRIPTGCGKTWAVLAPFLYARRMGGPARLIYALPLRTLAQGVYRVAAEEAALKSGLPIKPQLDREERQRSSQPVTLQTGEQPDDPFFTRGTIIVTTYDQVLSGLLGGPYGLSSKLHNINAAAMLGTLVVFDEFHLMAPDRAFLTAVAGNQIFRNLTQSVWMTATATTPLLNTLSNALHCEPVPLTPGEMSSLPSISRVERRLVVEVKAMTAADILRFSEGRSIVLLNTVGRAQKMFQDLKAALQEMNSDMPLLLLHSRFFKQDRVDKEGKLQSRFGRNSKGPAILVATQVVEAGLDISCDHLHTELCPMNSLVQRAGRCARFPEETGTVHVYPLPEQERAWLPYGSLSHENNVLGRTRELLNRPDSTDIPMTPSLVADWIEHVHSEDDRTALRQTWHLRRDECLKRIERNAIGKDSVRVADLIRGDDTERVRVIVAGEKSLSSVPSEREGVSLSRWSVMRLLVSGQPSPGCFWDFSEDRPQWKPLTNEHELKMAYVICLQPEFAAYDQDVGLRLGECGVQESPLRVPPPRPGHGPLHAESWLEHAINVSKECRRRFDLECPSDSMFAQGLKARFCIEREQMAALVEMVGLLHDMGKLNQKWQSWAEEAQRLADPSKLGLLPLAHTDFDSGNVQHRRFEAALRERGIQRPAHAAQGAYLFGAGYAGLLSQFPEQMRAEVASACAAAILAHHGGWLPDDVKLSALVKEWSQGLEGKLPLHPDEAAFLPILKLDDGKKSRWMEELLKAATHSDKLNQWWPLVAYLIRTLRLSDQRATQEGGSE